MGRAAVSAHTPGPWAVRFDHDQTGYPCYFIRGFSGDQKRDVQLHAANSNLIAAAPDLLAAVTEYLEWGAMTGSDRDLFDAKFRAAIAKAEGR